MYPDIRSIHLGNTLPFGIWNSENRGRDETGLQFNKGHLSLRIPAERYLGGGKSSNLAKVPDQGAVGSQIGFGGVAPLVGGVGTTLFGMDRP